MEKKDFGQHFLIDDKILKKEVDLAQISKEDKVIEIGAGNGNLTKEILKKTKNFISFEIDKTLKDTLPKEILDILNFNDAIKFTWKGYNKIVANIPYYLSEKIIRKAIREEIESLVLIVGDNFKKILENKENEIGYFSNLFFDLEIIEKIPKNSFNPPPRVNSWLIKLNRKSYGEGEQIRRICLKNGKIKNAILSEILNLGKTKREAKKIIKDSNFIDKEIESSTKNIKRKTAEKIKIILIENKPK